MVSNPRERSPELRKILLKIPFRRKIVSLYSFVLSLQRDLYFTVFLLLGRPGGYPGTFEVGRDVLVERGHGRDGDDHSSSFIRCLSLRQYLFKAVLILL